LKLKATARDAAMSMQVASKSAGVEKSASAFYKGAAGGGKQFKAFGDAFNLFTDKGALKNTQGLSEAFKVAADTDTGFVKKLMALGPKYFEFADELVSKMHQIPEIDRKHFLGSAFMDAYNPEESSKMQYANAVEAGTPEAYTNIVREFAPQVDSNEQTQKSIEQNTASVAKWTEYLARRAQGSQHDAPAGDAAFSSLNPLGA
jgi:hypothetical protein